MKNKLLTKLKRLSTIGLSLALGISCLSGSFALPVQAAEEGKYSTYFGSSNEDNHIDFGNYRGMYLRVSGTHDGQNLSNLPAFCVEKGLPFRSMVSDLEQCKIEDIRSGTGESLGTYSTIAKAIRGYSSIWDSNASGDVLWTQWASKCFVGWGTSADYTINSDWTNVTFNRSADADLTNIPSSSIINETFDMDDIDEENDNYNNKSDYSGQFIPGNFTGHEGSKPVYATYLKEIVWPENEFKESQKNALAYIGYFILEDEDTVNTYSASTRYEVAQALTWATEFGFMDTKKLGAMTYVTFHTSSGKYSGGTATNVSCDDYVKLFIGDDYNAMKLYREFVWKVKNAIEIPSFAYDNQIAAKRNPITLKWDAKENSYVAVISDENGVAKYFNFDLGNGTQFIDNGNGTFTIKSVNAVNTVVTSPAANNTILPGDCEMEIEFWMPVYLKWELEGTQKDFYYATLTRNYTGSSSGTPIFLHLHGLNPDKEGQVEGTDYYPTACNWICTTDGESITHCEHTNCIGVANVCQEFHCTHTCLKDANGNIIEYGNCQHTTCTDNEYGNCNGTLNDYNHYQSGCIWSCRCCGASGGPGSWGNHNINCGKDNCQCSPQNWGPDCSHGYNSHTHTDACKGCTHSHDATCVGCTHTSHNASCSYYYCKHRGLVISGTQIAYPSHDDECKHNYNCNSFDDNNVNIITNGLPTTGCHVSWQCDKQHYKLNEGHETITGTYVDWQDIIMFAPVKHKVTDPTNAYIAIETERVDYPCESDVNIELIDYNGNKADYIKVGEPYKFRYTYTYKGASKDVVINTSTVNKTYYNFNYLTKMTLTNNTTKLYDLRDNATVTSGSVVNAVYADKLVDVDIRGSYTTGEQGNTDTTTYPKATYKYDSQELWNDTIKINALTGTDTYIEQSSTNTKKVSVDAKITNDETVTITWVYETPYEVFTSAVANATGYIYVGGSQNYVSANFNSGYNYGETEDHNNVGDTGSFERTELATKNSELPTYTVKHAVWQSDVDIDVNNIEFNTGAGITQPIYSATGQASHWVNYNLYYTVNLKNDTAHYYEKKVGYNKGTTTESQDEKKYENLNYVLEFDTNNRVEWGYIPNGIDGEVIYVDHIKTGDTYIQKELPVNLPIYANADEFPMSVIITANKDKLIYEDEYSTPTFKKGSSTLNATQQNLLSYLEVQLDDLKYNNNREESLDVVFYKDEVEKPLNIQGANNYNTTTKFNIKMAHGYVESVTDRDSTSYKEYEFTFNPNKVDNKVTFGNNRLSVPFFKYSTSNYNYNNKNVVGITGNYINTPAEQTEKYYISKLEFKSNYTTKNNLGNNGWIDMVTDNDKAIVAAGQGFELKINVAYENSFLTNYFARYFGNSIVNGQTYIGHDAINSNYGTSYISDIYPRANAQRCNISALTLGKNNIYDFTVINNFTTLDRLAQKLITGSNVYADIYCFMSDNPNTVYSYSGQYNTPVIFDRKINYNASLDRIEFEYTMAQSENNGVANSKMSKKFFTSALAPDANSPGIVSNGNAPTGSHTITIWTPITAATGFEYPEAIQNRYIGDAIEIGYSIKSTGADDDIVHIVQ